MSKSEYTGLPVEPYISLETPNGELRFCKHCWNKPHATHPCEVCGRVLGKLPITDDGDDEREEAT